ncbi:MAG: hypothetical protein JNJ69_17860 [Leptospiraceae bacterium]|nr:hypothetical protein [Leptospiraceae bacterium]
MRAPALLILSLCALLHCQSWRKFWATSAPQNISFGNQRLDKLIPGLTFS